MIESKATDRQILEAINGHIQTFGYPPTIRFLCDAFGYGATSTMQRRIDNLVARGFLTHKKRQARTLRLTELGLERIGRM